MLKVKICGSHTEEDFQALSPFLDRINHIGLIFTPASRRFVSVEKAEQLLDRYPTIREKCVGVFLNQGLEEIISIITRLGIETIQLHGEEAPSFCKTLKEQTGCRLWKVFHIPFQSKAMHIAAMERVQDYREWIDAIVLDTATKQAKGGTGINFDWQLINSFSYVQLPLYIAGGVNADNLKLLPDVPNLVGVDIASGAETPPYKKDLARIESIVKQIEAIHIAKGEE